jgi:hypothetical protein
MISCDLSKVGITPMFDVKVTQSSKEDYKNNI